jgi:N-formylglutamate deformylase
MAHFHTDQAPFRFMRGTQPLLVSMPHVGTFIPPDLAQRMSPTARQVPDTDWHLERLYDFAKAMGASVLVATHSRYVIDLNRPPDDASLYPGQNVTGLCPVDTFEHAPLYAPGEAPSPEEIEQRRKAIWQPYHDQLAQELARLCSQHGRVVLWDAHSIRSVVPRFFEGQLPDLNLGTADGNSCAPALAQNLLQLAQSRPGYTAVLNGRFKGGYITRHFGQPHQGVHAVQLEMTQRSYMQESMPFDYDLARAALVQPVLQAMLASALAFASAGQNSSD